MRYQERMTEIVKKFVDDVTALSYDMAREQLLSAFDLTNNVESKIITDKAVKKIAKATKKVTKRVAKKTVKKIQKQAKKEKRSLKARQKDAKRAYRLRQKEKTHVLSKDEASWLKKYNTKVIATNV